MSEAQCHLSVRVDVSQEADRQVQQVINKLHVTWTYIAKWFCFRNRGYSLQLYRMLVRPHLDYRVHFGPLTYNKYIIIL